jgi:hypothetical protein
MAVQRLQHGCSQLRRPCRLIALSAPDPGRVVAMLSWAVEETRSDEQRIVSLHRG